MSVIKIESVGDNDVEISRSDSMLVTRLDTAVKALEEKEVEFAAYLKELKAHEENVAKLKAQLLERMDNEGVKKLESERLIFTAVHPKPRHSIDTKKLQAINPKLYEKVDAIAGKDTETSGYVKITLKETI